MSLYTDLNEGQTAEVCCLECHHAEARYGMATPVIYGDVSLDCGECGTEIVRWREF